MHFKVSCRVQTLEKQIYFASPVLYLASLDSGDANIKKELIHKHMPVF